MIRRSFDRAVDALIPPALGVDAEFEHYRRRLALRNGVIMCGVFLVAALLGWPSDRLLFGERSQVIEALARWRIQITAITAFGLAVAQPVARRARLILPMITIVAVALAVSTGLMLAHTGGPDRAWFHTSYVAPLAILPLSLALGARVALTIVVTASLTGTYFAVEPEYLQVDGIGTVAIVVGLTATTACILGHIQYRLIERSYQQQVQLARINADLEGRVTERTRRLRQLAAHLQHSRDQERQRLGRDLHDELAQLLTAMRLELSLTRREAPASLMVGLDRVERIVVRMFDAKERLVRSLKPLALEELGFAGALRHYADGLRERTELEVGLELELRERVPPEAIATSACRILQEALNNIARHAEASHVMIRVIQDEPMLEIHVEDDGVGFVPAEVPDGHFGLLGISERVEALGGEFAIHSSPGRGTRISVALPPRPLGDSFT